MLMKEIMHDGVIECTEDTALVDVYEMLEAGPDDLIVVIDSSRHRVPIGVITEHSICENLVRSNRTAKQIDACAVMSSSIVRISENSRVGECGRLLSAREDAIVVVDENQRFKGIVEPADLRTAINRLQQAHSAPASLTGSPSKTVSAGVELPAFGWPR